MSSETEQQLSQQIEELKRRLAARNDTAPSPEGSGKPPHPSRAALWLGGCALIVLFAAAFAAGYIPRHRREAAILADSRTRQQAIPVVSVAEVVPSAPASELVLPGNIQALTEAPILARADGYIKKRYADIGDRVQPGQLLAELEAPELDQQVRQARANLEQARAAVEQASANYQQGQANEELAGVTARRWANLAAKGVVSRQENDQYQAQYRSQVANSQALSKGIAAARSNVSSSEANLARLQDLQNYKMVRAPFRGVITLRNVDTGALVAAGNTLLFRIAQTGTLRAYVNVPQSDAASVHVGQPAQLTVTDLPGRRFTGRVTRTANTLDPASRTLLTEVQIPNPDGALLPGSYASVDLNSVRENPPLLIPGDALVVRADGPQVAVVGPDHKVHFQKIDVGRDYGDRLEVVGGLKAGDRVIVNPGDTAHEGAAVAPVLANPRTVKGK
ncbi:MAG: efflux RND transporter periplasmic adaptor subunit [Bryobacteraceae bacterium]